MIYAKLPYNTKNIHCNHKVYCSYCGREIHPDTEIDHNEVCEYYHCDCEDAMTEIRIHKEVETLKAQIKRLEAQYPEAKYASVMVHEILPVKQTKK